MAHHDNQDCSLQGGLVGPDVLATEFPSHELVERIDLHYYNNNSNKYYCITIQVDPEKWYRVGAFYGRVGNAPQSTELGRFRTLSKAQNLMRAQEKKKIKKGYDEVGHWVDYAVKNKANGALSKEVLQELSNKFPPNSTVQSPSGNSANVISVEEDGSLSLMIDDEVTSIPFGKYGNLKVIS